MNCVVCDKFTVEIESLRNEVTRLNAWRKGTLAERDAAMELADERLAEIEKLRFELAAIKVMSANKKLFQDLAKGVPAFCPICDVFTESGECHHYPKEIKEPN